MTARISIVLVLVAGSALAKPDRVPQVHTPTVAPTTVAPWLFTFDPYACEPHSYAASGPMVLGIDGDRCVFRLLTGERAGPGSTPPAVTCRVERTAPPVTVPYQLPQKKLPGATCTVAPWRDDARTKAALADPGCCLIRTLRASDTTPEIDRDNLTSIHFKLGIWPRSRHRADLATLDPAQRVVRDREVIFDTRATGDSIFRGLFYAKQTFPKKLRFSMPIYDSDEADLEELARGLGSAKDHPYVAVELEVIDTQRAQPVNTNELDVGSCIAGRSLRGGYGDASVSVAIVGPRGHECVYTINDEVEGGYTIHECVVARSVGRLQLFGGSVAPRPTRCELKKQGNVFLDAADFPSVSESLIVGTRYVINYVTPNLGAGSPLRSGEHVTLDLSVWGPAPSFEVWKAQDATTARVLHREVVVVVGDATLGPALDSALVQDGLRHGGQRRYEILTDAAGSFCKALGLGNVLTQQRLVVDFTVR